MTQRTTHRIIACTMVLALPAVALAKLPAANPSPEEKAKAAEAAAKTAWSNKVADFQLCKSMDRSAMNYFEVAKKRGATAAPDPAAPACTDPGPFTPPEPKPLEAAGAHSPAATAATPPNTRTPSAELPKK